MENIEEYSLVKLKELATGLGIKTAQMRKAELVSAIKRKERSLERKAEMVAQLKKKDVKSLKEKYPLVKVKTREIKEEDMSPGKFVKQELQLPVYDNYQVVKILENGHNSTHLHCLMANGNTVHVPRKLFNG